MKGKAPPKQSILNRSTVTEEGATGKPIAGTRSPDRNYGRRHYMND